MKEKIAAKLEALLPEELVNEIKAYHAKLSEAVTPAATELKLMKEAVTKDGKKIATESEWVVGAPVMEVTEAGASPAVDGTYEVEGKILTVVGGLITEIKEVEVEVEDTEAKKYNDEMKAQMDAQKSEIADLKARLENVNKQNVDLAAALKKILDTPIQVQQSEQKEVKLEELSPLERRRYLKSLNK